MKIIKSLALKFDNFSLKQDKFFDVLELIEVIIKKYNNIR
jgi:hypothetical protein